MRIPPPPSAGAAAEGAKIFEARTCQNCHRIAGTPAGGRVGPDLTHVADRDTLGAGVLENDPHNLARWISNPQLFKPGCHMPDMRLTDHDARAIAAYLEGLR